ncbi:MAG: hypothetical protein FWB71_07055, partial [Defluviitaleaceae bacterium]|nr:hypothetical protein [Defluviitaleaceae bacterium]
MKKCITIVFLISIFLIALPMTACGGSGVREYFPFQENVLLTYASQCDEPFYYHVFIDYIRDTRIQRRMIFRNIMWAEILEVRDGGIVLVNMFDDFFEHVDMTARPAQLYGRV